MSSVDAAASLGGGGEGGRSTPASVTLDVVIVDASANPEANVSSCLTAEKYAKPLSATRLFAHKAVFRCCSLILKRLLAVSLCCCIWLRLPVSYASRCERKRE